MKNLSHLDTFDPATASQAELAAVILALQERVRQDSVLLREREVKIDKLIFELAYYKRLRFASKSEALPGQLELFEETLATDVAAIESELEQLQVEAGPAAKPKRPRAGRQVFPPHLTRIEHRHEPASCACDQCGREMVNIGEDVAEQLDVEPAKFFVHRHIRPQYACRACETVKAEPVPPAIMEGGMAAVGLLTWIMVSKYLDHLPLYRLTQIAARDQVILSRSTLAEWVGRTGVALQPLAERLRWHLLQGDTLHADETPVAQQDPGSGKTKKAYLWAYRSNDLAEGPGKSGAQAAAHPGL